MRGSGFSLLRDVALLGWVHVGGCVHFFGQRLNVDIEALLHLHKCAKVSTKIRVAQP
jgi:hypothetical protein